MPIRRNNAELTYCLNVHPGATLDELEQGIFVHARKVFDKFTELTGIEGPFGLGVWFSAATAEALEDPETLEAFRQCLAEDGFYVLTINGFPFGKFHDTRVKTDVYRPDWSDRARLEHTLRLARLLAQLLPEDGFGTISTVPITYGAWADDELVITACRHLAELIAAFDRIRDETGRIINIALEPEPDCYLEDLPTVLHFHENFVQSTLVDELAKQAHCSQAEAQNMLKQHFGYCMDMIHMAVAFENPLNVLFEMTQREIPISKVHIGAALASAAPGPIPPALTEFNDDVYLHQTRLWSDAGIERFADLPDALAAADAAGAWRVHYHVPLIWEGGNGLASTRDVVDTEFFELVSQVVHHFEVETYTLSLFPDKSEPDEHILARELAWVAERFTAQPAAVPEPEQ